MITASSSTGVDVGLVAQAAALPLFIVLTLGLALIWVARPWELKGGSWLDRLRVGEAVNNYDFWLSLRGVGGRRRRDLRDELRANLWDATARIGSKAAVRAVGSTRRLAAASSAERAGARWGQATAAGLTAVELVVMLQFLLTTVWADAADAAKVSRLSGSITLVPGMRVSFERIGSGFSLGTDLGPSSLVVGLLVFVLVARPWRVFARRSGRQPAAS